MELLNEYEVGKSGSGLTGRYTVGAGMRQGERASALRAGLLLGAFWRKKQENAVGPAGHGPRHRGTGPRIQYE